MFRLTLVIVALLSIARGFYLPGVAPVQYKDMDEVYLKVNKLTSVHTQVPIGYYSLPVCRPDEIVDKSENLGEILKGDKIENSPYELKFRQTKECDLLCVKSLTVKETKLLRDRVKDEYRMNWILDNLPAAQPKTLADSSGLSKQRTEFYEIGFPLGFHPQVEGSNGKRYFLYNHHNITVFYHFSEGYIYRIVGFEVVPYSVHHRSETNLRCPPQAMNVPWFEIPEVPKDMKDDQAFTKVIYTYSVDWRYSATPWANRWDKYLLNTDPQIHWFSIINSLMIVLFLTGMVAMIMMRTLRADLRRYNQLDAEETEETGWKLVHGDVFRPPQYPMAFSVLVGSGVQVFSMAMITLVFAVLGFLSPANRGGLLIAMVVLYIVMGLFAGYTSGRLYKMFKGQAWKRNTILTATVFPVSVFVIFFAMNIVLRTQKSTGAVPVLTGISLILMWFGISVPLVFLGSYFAYKKPTIEHPVRTNQIPRQIPEQMWYMHPAISVMMGGILPFGAVFIELFFILSAIWGHQFYYIFTFLFMVFVILIITSAEITIVMCYFQLCSEDYHWWWRSYLTAASAAFYMFLYAIFYFFTRLEITKFASGILYFGYTFVMAFGFFVLTGTIGFYACFWFVRKIYSQVKVD